MKYAILYDGKLYIADERWITINADKETGQKGQHVLIKENGDIVFGLGGKFKNLRELGKNNKRGEFVKTKDELADFLQTKEGERFRKLADPHFSIFDYNPPKMKPEEIINYNPVKYHEKQPTEEEIIDTLGGGDRTKGSCVSVAFAYTAQKDGMNVLDFRGEPTRSFFSDDDKRNDIFKDAIIATETDTVKGTLEILKNVVSAPVGKEFLLGSGSHMAVVRKDEDGFIRYLELQSRIKCGWRQLGSTFLADDVKKVLRKRFKTQMYFRTDYKKKGWKCNLIDCDKLRELEVFKYALGFINTDADKQQKGAGGRIR